MHSKDWRTRLKKVIFDKSVFAETQRTNAGSEGVITRLVNYTVVYKRTQDLYFFVTGRRRKDKLILDTVLNAFFDFVTSLLREKVDKMSEGHDVPLSTKTVNDPTPQSPPVKEPSPKPISTKEPSPNSSSARETTQLAADLNNDQLHLPLAPLDAVRKVVLEKGDDVATPTTVSEKEEEDSDDPDYSPSLSSPTPVPHPPKRKLRLRKEVLEPSDDEHLSPPPKKTQKQGGFGGPAWRTRGSVARFSKAQFAVREKETSKDGSNFVQLQRKIPDESTSAPADGKEDQVSLELKVKNLEGMVSGLQSQLKNLDGSNVVQLQRKIPEESTSAPADGKEDQVSLELRVKNLEEMVSGLQSQLKKMVE